MFAQVGCGVGHPGLNHKSKIYFQLSVVSMAKVRREAIRQVRNGGHHRILTGLSAMMGLLTRIHSFYLLFIGLRFRKIVFSKELDEFIIQREGVAALRIKRAGN
ncbi:hypothetical protein CDAR_384751 [Caerostris darwini]|uniref:Uncharacterized protein n=1 Tax=Caerostris darwini TaxID=1538125 RepID=A0AAV4WAF9_9ARAC|nr:hypothetical protein CDAR_384751 [Caerostris darwini]